MKKTSENPVFGNTAQDRHEVDNGCTMDAPFSATVFGPRRGTPEPSATARAAAIDLGLAAGLQRQIGPRCAIDQRAASDFPGALFEQVVVGCAHAPGPDGDPTAGLAAAARGRM